MTSESLHGQNSQPQSLEHLTLQQKLSHANQLTRELIEFLEHGFIPKTQDLMRTAQRGIASLDQNDVTDLSIRSTIENVLRAGNSTRETADHLVKYLNSIETDVHRVLTGP